MEFLASSVEWNTRHKAIISRALEVGNLRTLLAELVKFLGCQALVGLDNVCRNKLSTHLVGHRRDDAVLYFFIFFVDFLDLHRIDILARRDDHVVLTAYDGNKLMLVPRSQIVGIEESFVVFLLCLLRIVDIFERRLGR